MKILVVGSGGREHALSWSIAKSPLCEKLYCAPGNAGIAEVAECLPIKAEDLDGLVNFVQKNDIGFVVVGAEAQLVAGLVDRLETIGIPAFGPSAAAAQLEGSKGYMKDFCAKYNIPTAAYARFTDLAKAQAYLEEQGAPIVIKTDGLAAGKGVTVAMSMEEAKQALEEALSGRAFGDAGTEVVIEEFMQGEEVSFFVLTDGENYLPLASAQDHKRVGEGDTGPNTGGMGAYSPAPVLTAELEQQTLERLIKPTIEGMKSEGHPYKGVLFAGLMLTDQGPRLIEYNVRFGDPECQTLCLRLKSDLLPALIATAKGGLDKIDLEWHDETALLVVMAAKGYPGSYEKNTRIDGLEQANATTGVTVFHAGTARDSNGNLLATGGRVLGVTALGSDIRTAQKNAYQAVDQISWPDGICRRDIGWRELSR
ncbi:phosphoribosylamine--glycine ligase [Kiloniella laminariae]|uniref:Phosphoribosylamine--glycine ligase n=1 Tax=Kiloniella laminariae TaxID=454162 RepID=A0ABT4LKY2_9PROT|nr:phosphoribosylamine--glycine ligase [Kiloniella laminariae]MCZ4281750.1 phosphoribosylamine--glycine ligase [Kiloniella laminariae]